MTTLEGSIAFNAEKGSLRIVTIDSIEIKTNEVEISLSRFKARDQMNWLSTYLAMREESARYAGHSTLAHRSFFHPIFGFMLAHKIRNLQASMLPQQSSLSRESQAFN